MKQQSARFWELDFLRGIAVCIMVIYHFAFDLTFFRIYFFDFSSALFRGMVLFGLPLFLFLVGIGIAVSYARRGSKRHFVLRGARIFLLGVMLTIITFTVFPERTILFGVLHHIGLAVMLAPLYVSLGTGALVLAASVAVLYLAKPFFSFSNPLLIPIGLVRPWWNYLDYEPLIPWFFFVLVGVSVGTFLYLKNRRRIRFPDLSKNLVILHVSWLGRHALKIYLLHQPVLLGIVFALAFFL